jgi:SAM-dependent methyltransferase
MLLRRIAQAPLVRRIRDQMVAKNGTEGDEKSIFAAPWDVTNADECDFYHTMDIPGHGLVNGQWDLRGRTDEYLGNYNFAGKRVLEIGPASGFLTFELEKRGADVVAVDVSEERPWDFVPYPEAMLAPVYPVRLQHMKRLKNSFWFAHQRFESQSQVWYGDVYNIPKELGKFDVAVMAAVLLHVKSPLLLMAECAKRASTLIITDVQYDDLEGKPVCRLHPTLDNQGWDTWWHLTSDIIRQFATVLGFGNLTTTHHEQHYAVTGTKGRFFTVVASR